MGDEAGEETDEGDMESWEVDYMSDSSSEVDEFKVGGDFPWEELHYSNICVDRYHRRQKKSGEVW